MFNELQIPKTIKGIVWYPYTRADFSRIRDLIYEFAGISLAESKCNLVYSRIARRVKTLNLESFADYVRLIETPGVPERQYFVNALTTNITQFFRENHHFPILAAAMKSIAARSKNVNIWSAGCSTGEEAYSIAITAIETFGNGTPPVRIYATDIDTSVLNSARAGEYNLENVVGLDVERQRRFFLTGTGSNTGLIKALPPLQRLIDFQQQNLCEASWALPTRFDIIFCRNVMIYFNAPTQDRIVQRFAESLTPDGLLFTGHSESFHYARGRADVFRTEGKSVVRLVRPPGRIKR